MPAAVKTAFEVAFRLADRALEDNEYLQPVKLQRLLYLTQACYAARHKGAALMPAVFVADELGPLEPNVYAAFSCGRPNVDLDPRLPPQADDLIERIWRTFGHHSTEHLARMTLGSVAYRNARARGDRAVINLKDMARMFDGHDLASARSQRGRRVYRTQGGRAVLVKPWLPPAADQPDQGDEASVTVKEAPVTLGETLSLSQILPRR